jgi:hypothetical protein
VSIPTIEVLIVAVCGGIASGFGVLIATLLRRPRRCAGCGEVLPRYGNRPSNRRQLLWGGWSCRGCGRELDRRGRQVPATA